MFNGFKIFQSNNDTPTTKFLKEAKAKINTPEKWAQGTAYRYNFSCFGVIGSVQLCSSSALLFAFNRDENKIMPFHHANKLMEEVAHNKGYTSYIHFNDDPSVTHTEMMKFWDEAIALSKDQPIPADVYDLVQPVKNHPQAIKEVDEFDWSEILPTMAEENRVLEIVND